MGNFHNKSQYGQVVEGSMHGDFHFNLTLSEEEASDMKMMDAFEEFRDAEHEFQVQLAAMTRDRGFTWEEKLKLIKLVDAWLDAGKEITRMEQIS